MVYFEGVLSEDLEEIYTVAHEKEPLTDFESYEADKSVKGTNELGERIASFS